jgi:IclR family transcriptional regulator, mhp operon transcriptional activator
MSRLDEYRGTTRTLQVLRALNEHNGATITQLSKNTKISRTALYRILGALEEAGYVRRRKDDGAVFLTSLVQMLSDGFKDEYWIAEIAGPVLDDLQRRVVWPTDLGICRNYALRLASTTRRHSPLVIDRGLVGSDIPLLRTALGIAYVAYCSAAEREALLDYLATKSNRYDGELARDRKKLDLIFRETRTKGYASRHGDIFANRRYPDLLAANGTIAVPIRFEGRSVASIGITFIASALTVPEAANRYLKDLMQAAHNIELKLEARRTPPLQA